LVNKIIKVGITGQSGFIGTHLFNYFSLLKDIELIEFKGEFFQDEDTLDNFISQCDVIVHLAAINRHKDSKVIYKTNISLVKKLIESLNRKKSVAHVIFSSSIQEDYDNIYGKSKKEGRRLLIDWTKKSGGIFTGLVIPNVFGPFGEPYYNSVISTFSHQLTHNEKPNIDLDGNLKLIYVDELTKEIYRVILDAKGCPELKLDYTSEIKVSELLEKLNSYKDQYLNSGAIPELNTTFEINLFNTYRSYIDNKSFFPYSLKQHADDRGTFFEIIRSLSSGQVSSSTTKPGLTRGNHFHTRKIERFTIIKGEALICIRRIGTNNILEFKLDGEKPAFVDMPIWYTHNITNIGSVDLYIQFWTNEFYDSSKSDTYFEKV
jgi:UDP-2-acetamido-2,6-beta-L-arabino-hexul-4-ose reductase